MAADEPAPDPERPVQPVQPETIPDDPPELPRPRRSVRAAGLALTSEVVRGVDRVTIVGELTAATAVLLDAETVELCRRSGDDLDLVLDLTGVDFLDMMGVAALRRAHCRALLLGTLRLGLPTGAGPGRMLALATDCGWLAPVFRPDRPDF